MARYINADEAVNALKRWFKFPDYNKGEKNIIACAITMLEEAPTADVASVTINENGRLVIDVSNIKDIMHGRAFEIYFGKGDDEKDD